MAKPPIALSPSETIFRKACVDGDFQVIRHMLTSPEYRGCLDVRSEADYALWAASGKGDIEAVRFLLTSPELSDHADIHAEQDVALLSACFGNHVEVVQYLLTSPELSAHADIHARHDLALCHAVNNNMPDAIAYLTGSPDLVEHIDIRTQDCVVLQTAIELCSLDCVHALLTSPAMPENLYFTDGGSLPHLNDWFDYFGPDFMFSVLDNLPPPSCERVMTEFGDTVVSRYMEHGLAVPDNLEAFAYVMEVKQDVDIHW